MRAGISLRSQILQQVVNDPALKYSSVLRAVAIREINNFALRDEAAGYYRFEADGTDTSPNARNLTVAGSPTFSAGIFGNCMDLGSSNSSKKATIANNMGITGGACSMSARVKINTAPSSGQYQDLLYQISATNNNTNRIYYWNDGGTLKITFGRDKLGTGGNEVTVARTLTVGTWYTLTYAYDGTTLRAYIDGVLIGSTAASGAGSSGGSNGFAVGVNAGGSSNYASAAFDDLLIIGRGLSHREVNLIVGTADYYDGSNLGNSVYPSGTTIKPTPWGNELGEYFDGSSAYTLLPNFTEVTARTIMGFFTVDDFGGTDVRCLLDNTKSGVSNYLRIAVVQDGAGGGYAGHDRELEFRVADNAVYSTGKRIRAKTPYFFTLAWNGSIQVLTINGEVYAASANAGTPASNAYLWGLGTSMDGDSPGGQKHKGMIWGLSIVDRYVTPAECHQIARRAIYRTCKRRNSAFRAAFSGDVSTAATVLTATFSVPGSTTTGGASSAPAVVSATFSIPAPTVTGGSLASPAAITATFTIVQPSVFSPDETVYPGTRTATFSIPTPVVTGAASATPATLSATFSVAGVTVTVELNTVVSVSAITAIFTIPAFTVRQGGYRDKYPTMTDTYSDKYPTLPL